jgi:hypothetical protein
VARPRRVSSARWKFERIFDSGNSKSDQHDANAIELGKFSLQHYVDSEAEQRRSRKLTIDFVQDGCSRAGDAMARFVAASCADNQRCFSCDSDYSWGRRSCTMVGDPRARVRGMDDTNRIRI